jgi:hypothetical protein
LSSILLSSSLPRTFHSHLSELWLPIHMWSSYKSIFNHDRRPKPCRVLNHDFLTRSSTQKLIPISHHGRYLQWNPCIWSKSLTITREWKLKKMMKESVYVYKSWSSRQIFNVKIFSRIFFVCVLCLMLLIAETKSIDNKAKYRV